MPVSNLDNAVKVDAGNSHTCAVTSLGAAFCWGRGNNHQLGDGAVNDALTPVLVKNITDAVDIGAGSDHTVVLRMTGAVEAWGSVGVGHLGNGSPKANIPLVVIGL